MGEPVTQGMFFEALTQMRKDFEERHRHIREDIQAGFVSLSEKLEHHAAEDHKVESRVQRIEDRAESAAEQIRKKTAWQAMGISGLIVVGVEAFKHVMGWK